ncbi:hypothetical protein [Cellulomonas sp. NS3]|uniref:hypothetical protein n=1 Tax=Cellulomonas sp. NS3 TaxID=2973977 RepID=UPI002161B01A|nr:hypothetical protein [Cellulomonas sp. NS3]
MDYGSSIPMTSLAGIGGGITLSGMAFEQLWAVLVAVGAVSLVAVEIRRSFRRGKRAEEA